MSKRLDETPTVMTRWRTQHGPYTITIDLGLLQDNGPEILNAVSVHVSTTAEKITSAAWRSINVPSLVQRALSELASQAEREVLATPPPAHLVAGVVDGKVADPVLVSGPLPGWNGHASALLAASDAPADASQRDHGGRPRQPRHRRYKTLRDVADIYNDAVKRHNRAPRDAVVDRYRDADGNKISQRTATRRIREAKDIGLIIRQPEETSP